MIYRHLLASALFCYLFALTTACSPSSSSQKTQKDYQIPINKIDSNSNFFAELKNAKLSCGDSTCSDEFETIGLVGILITMENAKKKEEQYTGQCTGFLYGQSDLVAINAHCLPDEVLNQKKKCSQFLGIKFPKTLNQKEEIRLCEDIVYVSNLSPAARSEVQQDFAFFKIKPVRRTPFRLSSKVIPSESKLKILKIDPPLNNEFGGKIRSTTCQNKLNSFLHSFYTTEKFETAIAFSTDTDSCHFVFGNSGSPVLNEQNEIVAIAQSFFKPAYIKKINSVFNKNNTKSLFKFPNELPPHFHMTQVACIVPPLNKPQKNNDCIYLDNHDHEPLLGNFEDQNHDSLFSKINMPIEHLEKIQKYDQEVISKLKNENQKIVQFKVNRLSGTTWSTYPACINKQSFLAAFSNSQNSSINLQISTKVSLKKVFHINSNFIIEQAEPSHKLESKIKTLDANRVWSQSVQLDWCE